jgi:putative ABC transport system substrate-binding protein
MVGRKKTILMAVLLAVSVLGGCTNSKEAAVVNSKGGSKVAKIGISQIVEHPALDSARKGMIEGLKSKGFEEGKNIELDYQNAQGDLGTAQTIAQGFVSGKKDLILAVATPSAQASYNATKDIPILITAVTDPVKAGLVKALDKPETNVSGTSDNIPIEKQFELIKQIVPNAKRVGVIYNTSESNSEIQLESINKAAPSFNFEIVASGVTNANEIPQVLNSILSKIDVLYVPTDNLVVSSMPLLTNLCYSKNIPIIGSEKGQVENGAVATTGIDYYKLGFETGVMAAEVLNGKAVKDMPVKGLSELQLSINTDTVKRLDLKVPKDLLDKAEKLTGGVK